MAGSLAGSCRWQPSGRNEKIQQMQLAIPVHERPERNALTVAVNCLNRTRKHAASVTAYSVLPAYPFIRCSTPKLHQQTTGKFGNEKELRITELRLWMFRAFSSQCGCPSTRGRQSPVPEHN